MILILIGPMGCGKTTIGELLAAELGWPFYDGDHYHPRENVEKMRAGIALTDDDRRLWLEILQAEIQRCLNSGQDAILACSALKQAYRDILGVDQDHVRTIYLKGSFDLLQKRIELRQHPYMNKGLLKSQLDTMEEPTGGWVLDASTPPEVIIRTVLDDLKQNATLTRQREET